MIAGLYKPLNPLSKTFIILIPRLLFIRVGYIIYQEQANAFWDGPNLKNSGFWWTARFIVARHEKPTRLICLYSAV